VPEAYEQLLMAALRGNASLFTRWDELEHSWRFIEGLEGYFGRGEGRPLIYPAGSRGPGAADRMLALDGRPWWDIDEAGSKRIGGRTMRIIDISMTIREDMPVYHDAPEKRPVHTVVRRIPPDGVNESALSMNLHTGTHLDAPLHMIRDGRPTEFLPLERLIAPCRVLDLTHVAGGITRGDLEGLDVRAGEFLLLKTENSARDAWREEFVYLEKSGAECLAERRVSGVGIDALGIERAQRGHETHITLMKNDVIILEGLRLGHVAAGRYLLIALPVKIAAADGAPARAVLVEGALPEG
jgi:arylformamidase